MSEDNEDVINILRLILSHSYMLVPPQLKYLSPSIEPLIIKLILLEPFVFAMSVLDSHGIYGKRIKTLYEVCDCDVKQFWASINVFFEHNFSSKEIMRNLDTEKPVPFLTLKEINDIEEIIYIKK